jgi:ribosome recycling factor
MQKELMARADKRMSATVTDFKSRLGSVRTGRASLGILDRVNIDYFGTPTPLNQVAKLSIPDPTLIVAQPFDPSTLQPIEKAISSADLGLNPSNDGKVIRIPIPPLTEERREQLIRKVHSILEDSKTAIRQVRRDANDEVKQLEKDGGASKDDAHRWLEEIQKKTNRHTEELDQICRQKESELREI